jgi:hypothetical protein
VPRTTLTKLTASLLAAGALVPAAAMAADIKLDERPTLTAQSKRNATVTFSTDMPYFSRVQLRKPLKAGQTYKVRIAIDGQEPIVRTLRVR